MSSNREITREVRRATAISTLMRFAVVLGGCGLLTATVPAPGQRANAQPQPPDEGIKLPVDETPAQFNVASRESFAPVVKKVAPAVVKVVTALSDLGDDPFWRYFFGQTRGSNRPQPHGLGSGVIVTEDGYILTNNHVVDGAKEVEVTLPDGRQFKAKVVGRDSQSDIAVLKIDAKRLPVLTLADSQKVQVGDLVLAIGNPFGVGQTVTHGIVSATDRGGMGIEDYESFIQTDAPINPGNSGGALVDTHGQLIGINTAILSRSGGNQGIGFAIPSDLARSVMTSLIKYGRVSRGYLGIKLEELTPESAVEFKLKQVKGVIVSDVVTKGPADNAGIKVGDVITRYNGQPVSDGRQLRLSVAETKPGQIVPVEVARDNSTKMLQVTVGELPRSDRLAKRDQSGDEQNPGKLSGVIICDLDILTRNEVHIPLNVRGALVVEVQPDSAAAAAGLQPGDVIQSINGQSLKSAHDAARATAEAKGNRLELRVWSKGDSRSLVADESKSR